jgi:hypothetical protein
MNKILIDNIALQHNLPYSEALVEYTRSIIQECVGRCDVIAEEANAAKKSNFTTDMGKQLFSGMWGGAMGCGNAIMMHFGIEVPEERM